jgi:hypothetical protein
MPGEVLVALAQLTGQTAAAVTTVITDVWESAGVGSPALPRS